MRRWVPLVLLGLAALGPAVPQDVRPPRRPPPSPTPSEPEPAVPPSAANTVVRFYDAIRHALTSPLAEVAWEDLLEDLPVTARSTFAFLGSGCVPLAVGAMPRCGNAAAMNLDEFQAMLRLRRGAVVATCQDELNDDGCITGAELESRAPTTVPTITDGGADNHLQVLARWGALDGNSVAVFDVDTESLPDNPRISGAQFYVGNLEDPCGCSGQSSVDTGEGQSLGMGVGSFCSQWTDSDVIMEADYWNRLLGVEREHETWCFVREECLLGVRSQPGRPKHISCELPGSDMTDAERHQELLHLEQELEEELEHELGEAHSLFILAVLTLVSVALSLEGLLHKHHIVWIPGSGVTMVVGLLCGFSIEVAGSDSLKGMLVFDEEFFTLSLLPMVIYEAGWSIDKRRFFKNWGTIAIYAVGGTIVSTIVVAVGLIGLGSMQNEVQLENSEAVAYAALISAIDPVATIAVFGQMGVDPTTNILVMGESIVNDAVSIVLYRTACGFVASGESANAASLGAATVTLTVIFVGSVVVGLFSSLVGTSMIMVAERQHGASTQLAQLQTALVLMFAYVAFEGAEALHFSGIIAALAAGVASKHYAFPHMCKEGRMLSKMTFPMVATLFETVIFFLCGVSVSQFLHIIPWGFSALTLFLCVLGRACNVFGLSALVNTRRTTNKINFKQQFVSFWSGLRGAIAFALCLSFPSDYYRPQIIGATSCIIFVTVFGLGGTTPMILGKLKMAGATDEHGEEEDLESLRASMALKFVDTSNKKGVAKLTAKTWGSVERIFVGTAGMAAFAEDHQNIDSRTKETNIDDDEEDDDNTAAPPAKMGALLKRGGKDKNKWQERYFAMLPADGLLWTVRGQTKKISVDSMLEVRPYTDDKVKHGFEVICGMPNADANKTYTFHAKSKLDNQEWMAAVARSIGQDPPRLEGEDATDRNDDPPSSAEQTNPLSGALGQRWSPEEAEL